MRESLDTLLDLLTRSEFQIGLVLGAVGLLLLVVIPNRPPLVRPWAVVMAGAVLIGVQIVDHHLLGLVVGVVVLALGGILVSHRDGRHRLSLLGWPIVVVGALLIPWRGQVDQDAWSYAATPLVAVGFGIAISRWRRPSQRRWLGPLVAITSFAIWTTVPDTDLARVLLGASLPMAFGTLPPISARLTSGGSFALGGVLAWLPTLGGEGRPASIIGAWASIGVIVLLPLARVIWSHVVLAPIPMFAVHSVITLVAARVIGLWTWAVPAAIAAIALYGAALVAIYWLGTRPTRPRGQVA